MYYARSENKGADQLRSYCQANLRLCFHLGKNLVFSRWGSNRKAKSKKKIIFTLTAVNLYLIIIWKSDVKQIKKHQHKKVQVGNDQEMAQSERNSHSKNRGAGKNMKTYIRLKPHKNLTPKHKTIRTRTEVSPWNDQQYKITGGGGGVLKSVLQGPNLTLIFCSGSQHLVSCSVLVVNL